MEEVTFLSHKARKELYKYSFVTIIAVITWILQVSIFSNFHILDANPNVILLGSIFFGLIFGPIAGAFYGIISSFFIASILYDHTFYLSFPIIGFTSGLITKNFFADELLFYLILCILFTLPMELFNGLQYSQIYEVDIFNRLYLISIAEMMLNAIIVPFYYFILNTLSKYLDFR